MVGVCRISKFIALDILYFLADRVHQVRYVN